MAGTQGKLKALQAADEQRRLSKAELLTPQFIEREVPIPALDGRTVVLRTVSYQKRMEIKAAAKYGTPEYDESVMELMSIAVSVIDPLLTVEDLEELKKVDIRVIDELSTQVSLLNAFGEVADMKKGSELTPSSDTDSS